jgi:hypothetical protein
VLKPRPAFPVATQIEIKEKLNRATNRYIAGVLREFYGKQFAKLYVAHTCRIAELLYEFGSTIFFDQWKILLRALTRHIANKDARDFFYNRMVGSTEYWVLLIALWERKLLGDDEDGYTMEMLQSLHQFTRYVEGTVLKECVKQLVRHGILETVEHDDDTEHFRLSDKYQKAFAAFGKELLGFRDGLRTAITESIELN